MITSPTIMFRAIVSAACAYIAMHNPNNIRSKETVLKKVLTKIKLNLIRIEYSFKILYMEIGDAKYTYCFNLKRCN